MSGRHSGLAVAPKAALPRREKQACLSQHGRTHLLVKRPFRHEVDGATEQVSERVLEVDDLPTEPGLWGQLVEQIDVAAVVGLTTGDRTEDLEPSDAVPSAEFVEPIKVDIGQLEHLNSVPRP